jgi:NAD(P)-dependent dehydrogenase (short-subunit alcohol dehydrogenase family)
MSSISARTPNPAVTVSIYAATKAATESLARDWAFEVSKMEFDILAMICGLINCSSDIPEELLSMLSLQASSILIFFQ